MGIRAVDGFPMRRRGIVRGGVCSRRALRIVGRWRGLREDFGMWIGRQPIPGHVRGLCMVSSQRALLSL